jgi:glycosyltransferase involved in cell wall biosynthesis
MDKPLVSVCIPSYNARDYIGETVASVLRQDYAPLEIVVQDDCSTDGTWEALQAMAAGMPQLAIARNNRNLGIGRNSTALLGRAQGKYVMILSNDDLLEPGFLHATVPILERGEAEVVTTSFSIMTQEKTYVRRLHLREGVYCRFGKLILLRNPFNINFTLIRRDLLDRIGYGDRQFSVMVTWDYDFWLRLAASDLRLKYLDKPLGKYRVHGENISFRTTRFNRPTLLAILRHKRVLRQSCRGAYRLTLVRFLSRMAGYGMRRLGFDRRLFGTVLREAMR